MATGTGIDGSVRAGRQVGSWPVQLTPWRPFFCSSTASGSGETILSTTPFAMAGDSAPRASRRASGDRRRFVSARLTRRLGVSGLPQSATGQTTLFTGVNAARVFGRHHPGIPGPSLQAILREDSLFHEAPTPRGETGVRERVRAAACGRETTALRGDHAHGDCVRCAPSAARRGRRADEALSHDYSGEWMTARGYPVTPRTAVEAAHVLARLLEAHDLVLYEYFLTDLVAHRGTREQRFEQARHVEALIDAILSAVDRSRHRVVVVSDHGNLEEPAMTGIRETGASSRVGTRRARIRPILSGRWDALTPGLLR